MRQVETATPSATRLFAMFLAGVVGCDSVDAGRGEEDPGPPRLMKIMSIQANNRIFWPILTDLLERGGQSTCDDTHPCPADAPGSPSCVVAEGASQGTCVSAYDPKVTPPAIDLVSNQLRLVFSKLLAHETVELLASASPPVALIGPGGTRVEATLSYAPSGGANNALPELFPYGPAIVLDTAQPLAPAFRYAITLDPSQIKDKRQQLLAEDLHGAIQREYALDTENLYFAAVAPDLSASIAPNDVVSFSANAALDGASLESLTVRTASGAVVPAQAYLHLGQVGSSSCALGASPLQLNLIATSSTGAPSEWAPGRYSVDLGGVRDAATKSAAVRAGPSGDVPFTAEFTVEGEASDPAVDPQARGNFVLPSDCGP